MTGGLELFPLLSGLFGGLALFLYGLDQMSRALRTVAGEQMRTILARFTANPLAGAASGAFVTAVVQSSSVTTVLVVGFISAGLMTFPQSIGVILGANVGTTVTAQVIAFKITRLALLMVAAGFAALFFGKRERPRQYGAAVLGLGLVFFGMTVMGEAMEPLHGFAPFVELMVHLQRPLMGILAGALFTALVQSSSASTGLVIVLASQGFITLPAGIALVFGSNVGTCVTALLAALGKPRGAVRAAVVHVLFNLAGVALWIAFIDELAALVTWISPRFPELAGAQRLAAEAPRQIANSHTIFNVANTLIFIGLTRPLARLVEHLVPERPAGEEEARPRYLDLELLSTPTLALDRARLELLHMGDRVRQMLVAILPAVLTGGRESLAAVEAMDDPVDTLHGHLVTYLGRISQRNLTEAQTTDLVNLMTAANELENIGDIIEMNLVALGRQRIDRGVRVSQPTREVIEGFHAAVLRAFDAAMTAVTRKNAAAAEVVVAMKAEINRLAESAALHEARRLVAAEPHRLPAYTVEVDVLTNLKRIYYFTKRLARGVLPETMSQ